MIMKIERGGRVTAGFLSLVLCFEKGIRGGWHRLRCRKQREPGDWKCSRFSSPLFPHGWNRLGEGAGAPVKNFFRVREHSERAGL